VERREGSLSDDVTGQCHFHLGESAVSARLLVRMHHRACNLEPHELLRQLQDIPEDESDASDEDIFEPNRDEDGDYEPPKTASEYDA
jgi:hypothetical protein